MRRSLRALDPLVWPAFGAGFFIVAFVFPSFAAVVGMCDLAGWLPSGALRFERARAIATDPAGGCAVMAAVILPLWNGAFHLRHTVMDLFGTGADRLSGPALYAIAAVGSAAAVVVLHRV